MVIGTFPWQAPIAVAPGSVNGVRLSRVTCEAPASVTTGSGFDTTSSIDAPLLAVGFGSVVVEVAVAEFWSGVLSGVVHATRVTSANDVIASTASDVAWHWTEPTPPT